MPKTALNGTKWNGLAGSNASTTDAFERRSIRTELAEKAAFFVAGLTPIANHHGSEQLQRSCFFDIVGGNIWMCCGLFVHQGSFKPVRTFTSPQAALGDLDAASVARMVGAASDITLVLNSDGVILDTVIQSETLLEALNDSACWIGQAFGAIVTSDSRAKTAALLQDARGHGEPKWRHVNHRATDGRVIPVLYRCVENGGNGRATAFGRDLSELSALHQRLLNAQRSMERDHARLRDTEEHYRLMFQQSSEAVLVLDPSKGCITESNAVASALCGIGAVGVSGRPLVELLDPDSLGGVQAQIRAVVAKGQIREAPARLSHGGRAVTLCMARLLQENAVLVLMCMVPVQSVMPFPTISDNKAALLHTVGSMPDAFVVTDVEGNVVTANAAFLEAVQLRHEGEVVGEPLERWVGATGVDMSVLIANLRSRGVVRFFATTVRGEQGVARQVEISAVAVPGSDRPALGFAIRNVGARVNMGLQANQVPSDAAPLAGRQLSRSVKQLTELIGRVSLKDMVRESTEVIERLAIEAALELTNDNRASAAEMLGLSRQTLYVKLHRYGIGDLTATGPT